MEKQGTIPVITKSSLYMIAALVMGLSVIFATGLVRAFLVFPETEIILSFVNVPPPVLERAHRGEGEYDLRPEYPGCYWLGERILEGSDSENVGSVRPGTRVFQIRCIKSEILRAGAADSALPYVRGLFNQSSDWELADIGVFYFYPDGANQPANIIVQTMILLVAVSLLLIRQPLKEDLHKAVHALALKPWLVLVLPVVALLSSTAFATMLQSTTLNENNINALQAVFELSIPSVAYFILFIPLIEELIFRQWLYVRLVEIMPPWLVAFGSSATFMIAHIFNPQVTMMSSYLPTVFVMGLVLFWVRHRFGSFSFAALAHMVNNGAFLTVAWWMASRGAG